MDQFCRAEAVNFSSVPKSIGLKDELSRFLQQEGGLFEPKEATLNKMNALAGRLPW